MKRVYWRPPGVSRGALALIGLCAVAALTAVESLPVQTKQRWYDEKMAAARKAREAMGVIKNEKLRRGISIDPESDPAGTGMIGSAITSVTSNTGYLDAKQTSANPNFAAVMVDLLKRAEVEKGDVVAVGLSGSFPALNISTFAAIHVLELVPISIAGISSSEWGANDPNFSWADWERLFVDKQVFGFRSVAASRGGIDDRGFGMSKEGRALLDAAIARNGLQLIEPKSLADSIDQRMQIYEEKAGGRPIKAYINVGGSTASVGTHVGKKQFSPGLNREPPRGPGLVDSVMLRFIGRDVPVLHVSQIKDIARQYGLSHDPGKQPRIGESSVYVRAEYNRWLAGGGLLVILSAMLAFIRMDVGMRILRVGKRNGGAQPQQMV
jgi:poly-gamma-glutamate system protein